MNNQFLGFLKKKLRKKEELFYLFISILYRFDIKFVDSYLKILCTEINFTH